MSDWQHHLGDTYQAIIGSAWMNETGHGIRYRTAGQAGTHSDAISRGFEHAESDDFNIGVIRNGHLVALLWMLELVDEEPTVLARIAEQTGHRP